ncbi:MAG: DUF1553 domain-containing protein [Acidobacteria bacterium]|nr:DUF1553 domain-containing protein [Acidobacteriota bacterium]MBI3655742.1 DUF1553 domain-containing protein [Acidobacteriota bacterium]
MKTWIRSLALIALAIGISAGIGAYVHISAMKSESSGALQCPARGKYPMSVSKPLRSPAQGKQADSRRGLGVIPRRNFIDDFIFDKMDQDGVVPAPLSPDEEFIRRVYLDLTGRIPSSQDVRDFLSSEDPNKRDNLIDALIASEAFIDKLTLYLGDKLENTAVGLNNSSGGLNFTGRTKYYNYLRDFLARRRPYNELPGELINANGNTYQIGPANYIAREWQAGGYILQDMQDDLVNRTASVFLGTVTLCVNCHNGSRFASANLNLWLQQRTRSELWGMSAFFSGAQFGRQVYQKQVNVEYYYDITERPSLGYDTFATGGIRPERRQGPDRYVLPRDIFSGDEYPLTDLRSSLAQSVVANPLFAKAAVNYLWADLMNLGIVDPPGGFDPDRLDPLNPPPAPWEIQPSHPELLDALAGEFVNGGYDLRSMVALIVKSSAYQLSTRYDGAWDDSYLRYFARRMAQRMSAEQIHDSISQATGVFGRYKIPQRNEDRRDANCPNVTTTVQWAHQLPDPIEPNCNPDAGARGFINAFERGSRYGDARKTPPTGSITQVLTLLNNTFMIARVRDNPDRLVKRLLDQGVSDEALVEELFIATLSRFPTDSERTASLAALQVSRQQGAENLHLALLNKIDFLLY